MEQIISKEEFNKLMSLKGEVKGNGMKTHAKFILEKEGKEGLKKLEEAMAQIGYPVKYDKIKATALYPLGAEALTLVAIKRLFNYDKETFIEMGKFHAKFSLIIRLFMRYFFSPQRIQKEAPKIWKSYFTVGRLEVLDLDMERKSVIFRIYDFKFHPIHCILLLGIFPTVLQMIFKNPVKCEETKCIHRGNQYHEFILKW